MNMIQIEEQAKMNFLAYSVAGMDHLYIKNVLIDEMSGRTPAVESPHFQSPARRGVVPRVGGVLQDYTWLVADDPILPAHPSIISSSNGTDVAMSPIGIQALGGRVDKGQKRQVR